MAEAKVPRRLVAGNWKMNGLIASLGEVRKLKAALNAKPPSAEVAICPPATLLATLSAELRGSGIISGGQDCHTEPAGAYTGDISAEMLADAGAHFVILGHSERRHGLGESDALIERKVKAARRAGLTPIVCVGETEGERDAGNTLAIVARQVAQSIPQDIEPQALVIAYEPVWAIGSGRVPSNADIEAVHGFIRQGLVSRLGAPAATVRILYGGSMKPSNAAQILKLKDVGGALVGGASLKADDFLKIIEAV